MLVSTRYVLALITLSALLEDEKLLGSDTIELTTTDIFTNQLHVTTIFPFEVKLRNA